VFVCEVTRCGLTLKKASSNFERSELSSEDDDLGHSAVEQLGRGADIRVEEEEEFCLLSFLSPEVARVSGRHNRGSGRQNRGAAVALAEAAAAATAAAEASSSAKASAAPVGKEVENSSLGPAHQT